MDKTVLGRYYAFADTEDLEKAKMSIQFELDQRAGREANGLREKERHEELAREVADVLKAAAEAKV
jgi:hypothetical protein